MLSSKWAASIIECAFCNEDLVANHIAAYTKWHGLATMKGSQINVQT